MLPPFSDVLCGLKNAKLHPRMQDVRGAGCKMCMGTGRKICGGTGRKICGGTGCEVCGGAGCEVCVGAGCTLHFQAALHVKDYFCLSLYHIWREK